MARGGPRRGHPGGRRRRSARRCGADAGGGVPDGRCGGGRGRDDLGFAQPARVQRHQDLRSERDEAAGHDRRSDRSGAERRRIGPRRRRPGAGGRPRAVPGAPGGGGRRTAGGAIDRRRLRERRRLRPRAGPLRAARRHGPGDPRVAGRAEHQRRLRGAPSRGRGRCGGRGRGRRGRLARRRRRSCALRRRRGEPRRRRPGAGRVRDRDEGGGGAPGRPRRHHRDGQHRLPPRDASGWDRRLGDEGRRPIRPGGDDRGRRGPRRRAVGPRHLPAARDHRRRSAHRRPVPVARSVLRQDGRRPRLHDAALPPGDGERARAQPQRARWVDGGPGCDPSR